jgi:hypothetical protein
MEGEIFQINFIEKIQRTNSMSGTYFPTVVLFMRRGWAMDD